MGPIRHPTTDGNAVTEQALIRRSKAGDRAAFGELVSRYQVPVYRVVRGVLADQVECEDVAQEVFLKAYANLSKFRGESGFFTWLYRIAVNEALRARKRRGFTPAEAAPELEAPPAPDPEEGGPSLHTVERLLRKLSDEFRSIVVLRDIEGLSYQEIAESLDIPLGTVESRLFRARQELRGLWRKMKEASNAL
jgi:RNA polymerase sigma-70 factor (ECF subfamily)